jgi:hypothetical protein
MIQAVRNLLLVTLLIAAIGIMGWVFMRHSDSVRENKIPHDHAFLRNHEHDVVAYRLPVATGQKFYDPDHLRSYMDLPEEVVIWLEVRVRLDGTLVAANDQREASAAPELRDVIGKLTQQSSRRLIINLRGHRAGVHESLAKIIDDATAGERVLIQSPEDGFLKDLREAKPLWLFGTSLPQVTRMILFSSMGLVTLAQLRGDVLVIESPAKEHLLSRITADMIAEAHRRKIKIYAGPVATEEQALQLWNRGIDSVLTSRPDKVLKSRPRQLRVNN